MFKIKFNLVVSLYLLQAVITVEIDNASRRTSNSRDARKLFGGYRITPRFCKPTRKLQTDLGGPNICMFNHECAQRKGQVVGACMDGFLFGACCQLPSGVVGELMESDLHLVSNPDNNLHYRLPSTTRPPLSTAHPTVSQITLNGVSQIAESLLKDEILPTAQDNAVVHVGGVQGHFSTTGVTHPTAPETFILHHEGNNEINSEEFRKPSSPMPVMEDRKTTTRIEGTTVAYRPVSSSPFVQISFSNAPDYYSTPKPILFDRPNFRPKPSRPSTDDKYVLIPTISHTAKPNKTQEFDSIVNIIHMLNESSTTSSYSSSGTYTYPFMTTRKPPSTSYIFGITPSLKPSTQTEAQTVTRKPPSTSYIFSSTPLAPRPGYKPSTATTKGKPSKRPTTKPTKRGTSKPSTLYFYPSTVPNKYIYSSTSRPAHSTFANSPDAFITTSKKPPSTSYVYSSTFSKRPSVTASTPNPSYTIYPTSSLSSVYSNPSGYPSSTSHTNYASPPPTIIILGPSTNQPLSTFATVTKTPPTKRKPVAHVTINNHVTHNLYSTENPSPTVIITPKPSLSSPIPIRPTTDYYTSPVEQETSVNDLINFPPVRNPNLNLSATFEEEFTTPGFLEDDTLNIKMESFVNKIVQSLQEPFQGLKDVVYNRNTTVFSETSTRKPTRKPTSKPVASTNSRPSSSRKPTRRPATTLPSRRPTTSSKKTTPPKGVTTTPQTYLETEPPTTLNNDYKQMCGVRPLVKSGRVVGGKGAAFGEFPWQVLVRESTWLGLFTKNKCGGVLISNRYGMTAAHCQPGFLASLVVVLGEHDISGERETKRSISRNVKRVIVHRQYDAATFENDLALLELEHPVQFDEHIVPICLPREGEDFTGRMATVTGWGRLKYGGGVPSILQEVQVPIMENHVCQEMFRTGGHNKVILESFLCAGYANGQKDSCEGDSGGPLVLQRPDGRYQLAGTVSHGIKCAAPYLPGVYMRTAYYKPWIESITGVH